MNWFTRCLIAVPALLGLANSANAQVCQVQGSAYIQAQPVAVQPYATTYAYQPQTINYPVVVGVPLSDLGINYYFSVSPEKRESRIVEQVSKELLSRMNQNGYGILVPIQQQPAPTQPVQQPVQEQPAQGQAVPPQPAPAPKPDVVTQPTKPNVSGQGGLPPAVQSQLQVLSLMQNKCMKCHKPGEIKKDIKLFNSDGSLFDNDLEKRVTIMNAILRQEGVSPMPPTQSLTSDEKKLIINWIQEKL